MDKPSIQEPNNQSSKTAPRRNRTLGIKRTGVQWEDAFLVLPQDDEYNHSDKVLDKAVVVISKKIN